LNLSANRKWLKPGLNYDQNKRDHSGQNITEGMTRIHITYRLLIVRAEYELMHVQVCCHHIVLLQAGVQLRAYTRGFTQAEDHLVYRVAAINPEFFSSYFEVTQHS
jgi:hypothetical protein